jgi:competence protein ComEC
MVRTGWTGSLSGAVAGRLYGARTKADAALRKYFAGDELAALEAMLLGIRSKLSPGAKKDFIRTGTMHVLAVSGMHTTMVAMMAMFVLRALFLPRRGYLAAAVIVVNAYAFMTGASPSALRAAFMCSACMFSKMFDRDADILPVLALAAIVMVFFDPGSVLDPGFVMSYLAVMAIVVFYPSVQEVFAPRHIGASLGISFVVWVSMIPVIAGYFRMITPVLFLSNIAAVSGFSVLLVFACVFVLAASVPAAQCLCPALSVILNKIMGFYLWVIHFFASIPYGNFGIRPIPGAVCAVYYLYLFFLAFAVKEAKKKVMGLLIALIAISNFLVWREVFPGAPGRGNEIIFFDVGKGDSSLIRAAGGETILIDGGSGEKSGFDRGSEVLAPALRDMGIRKIDTIFISHAHEDHFGGLLSLVDEFDIGGFITSRADAANEDRRSYLELRNKAARKGIKWSTVKSGDLLLYEGLGFLVLNPPEGHKFSGNDSSLVLRMETASGNSVLFTGDAECAAMKSAMRYAGRLRSDIAKAPHHGGNTGDALVAWMFFEKITPGAVILSRAYDQSVSSGTVRAFADKAAVYDTSECGAVTIKEKGNDIEITKYLGNIIDRRRK